MRKRTLAGALAAAVAVLGLAPIALAPMSARADHCHSGLLIFSGAHAEDRYAPSTNPGTAGCILLGWEDENLDTNYLNAGATFFSVGSYGTPADGNGGFCDPEALAGAVCGVGEVLLDGPDGSRVVNLTFTKGATRWDSQRVHLDGATVVTATVQARTGHTLTTTYRAVTEDLS